MVKCGDEYLYANTCVQYKQKYIKVMLVPVVKWI